MAQDFGYHGEQEAYFNEDPQNDTKLDQILELLREMKKDNEAFLEEMKKYNEEIDRSLDVLVKQEETIHLTNQAVMSSIAPEEYISPEPVIVVEEPINDVIPVCLNPPFELNMTTDKCGEDGLSKKKRKVSLLDLGQIMIKWPRNDDTSGSMASKKVKAHRINYRSYIGNSVGKCGVVLSNISKKGQQGAYHVNHQAYIGNVVGKCALRPP